MKNFVRFIVMVNLCVLLFGCSDSESVKNDNEVNLSDFPKIEEMSSRALDEMNNSPAFQDTKTKVEYDCATSNSKGTISLHYKTTNDGEVSLLYDTEGNYLKSASVKMIEEKALSSEDFIAIVSAFSSISDFNITSEQYSKIGEIVTNMETTMVDDLTVSMKNLDGVYEFMIINQ